MAKPEQQPDQEARSESLLPKDDAEDGRYDVAEEVNADQQSDAARRIGKPPKVMGVDGLADDDIEDEEK
jgi:hypothetical protein